jgi:hypothetical protein
VYCITDNGMILAGQPNYSDWDCGRLNSVESKMVGFLGHGERLKNYVIELHPAISFRDPWNRDVGGYTECATKGLHIGYGHEVFAHELAHALQNCYARQPSEDGGDWDHANWAKDGIYQMITEASE